MVTELCTTVLKQGPALVSKRYMVNSNSRTVLAVRGNTHGPEEDLSSGEGEEEVDDTHTLCGNTDPPSPIS
eukprot:11200299-Lingulodinium_polyedra.AAC.1